MASAPKQARVVPIELPPARRALGFLTGRGTTGADLTAGFEADISAISDAAR